MFTKVRLILIVYLVALILSGITASFVPWEMTILRPYFRPESMMAQHAAPLAAWLQRVDAGITQVQQDHPWMFYGLDWLTFGHVVIGIGLTGAVRNPLRNIWAIEFCLIACLLVIPAAIICGSYRGIPWFWQCIDCSFGVFGAIPLWWCREQVRLCSAAG